MLHVVGGGVDDAGKEEHAFRQPVPGEHPMFVLVARVAQGQRERPHLRAEHDGEHRLQGDVVDMGAVVVAPAEMEPDAVGRDAGGGPVDGLHVERDRLQETVEGVVLEEAHALHGQVGAVELENEAARVDELVLLPHLVRERQDVAFV
jgi:hypothetical protein